MFPKEKFTLKDIARTLVEWMLDRRPGTATLEWLHSRVSPLSAQIVFPEMRLSTEEYDFLPSDKRLFFRDGTMPASLRKLDRLRLQLTEIGGRMEMKKLAKDGMLLELDLPAHQDEDDITEKIELIEGEIKNQIHRHGTGGIFPGGSLS